MLLALLFPANYRCLFSKLGSYNGLYSRSLKASKPDLMFRIEGNVIRILQVPRSPQEEHRMRYHFHNFQFLRWFLRPANFFQKRLRAAQICSTGDEDNKCHASILSGLIGDPCVVFLNEKLEVFSKTRHVWYQNFQ